VNCLGHFPLLTKADCCGVVRFAVRYHDEEYRDLKSDALAFVPHETAIAAVRHLAMRHRWPQYREALRILQGPPYTPPADQPD
jgi:hypothetical protein